VVLHCARRLAANGRLTREYGSSFPEKGTMGKKKAIRHQAAKPLYPCDEPVGFAEGAFHANRG